TPFRPESPGTASAPPQSTSRRCDWITYSNTAILPTAAAATTRTAAAVPATRAPGSRANPSRNRPGPNPPPRSRALSRRNTPMLTVGTTKSQEWTAARCQPRVVADGEVGSELHREGPAWPARGGVQHQPAAGAAEASRRRARHARFRHGTGDGGVRPCRDQPVEPTQSADPVVRDRVHGVVDRRAPGGALLGTV